MESNKIDDKMTTLSKIAAKGSKNLTTLTKTAKAVANIATRKGKSRRKKQLDTKFATPTVANTAGKLNTSKSCDKLPKLTTKIKSNLVRKINNTSKGRIILNKKQLTNSKIPNVPENKDIVDNIDTENTPDSDESEYKTIINEDSRPEIDNTSGTVQPDLNFTQINDPNNEMLENGQIDEKLNSTHWEVFRINYFAF